MLLLLLIKAKMWEWWVIPVVAVIIILAVTPPSHPPRSLHYHRQQLLLRQLQIIAPSVQIIQVVTLHQTTQSIKLLVRHPGLVFGILVLHHPHIPLPLQLLRSLKLLPPLRQHPVCGLSALSGCRINSI